MEECPVFEDGSLEDVCYTTMARLIFAHERIWPDRGQSYYGKHVMQLVGKRDDASVTAPEEIVNQFLSEQELASEAFELAHKALHPLYVPQVGGEGMLTKIIMTQEELQNHAELVVGRLIKPIYISTAYCGRALKAFWKGNEQLAWPMVSEGIYWCGVADAFSDFERVLGDFKMGMRQRMQAEEAFLRGLKAADKREKMFAGSRAFAYELVRAHVAKSGSRWPSINEFLLKHGQKVHDHVYDNNPTFKKRSKLESFEKTLQGWLSSMPDAATLFLTLAVETKRDRARRQKRTPDPV